MSSRLYEALPGDRRPPLEKMPRKQVNNADGSKMTFLGTAVFEIQLGSVVLKKSLLIADIEDDALLGGDILQRDEGGPADILLSEGHLTLRGRRIPLQQVVRSQSAAVRKVRAVDKDVIPPLSEKVVDVMIDDLSDGGEESAMLVQSNPDFVERYGVVVGASLVDPTRTTTVKLRLMNPNNFSATIHPEMVLGLAESIDGVQAEISEPIGGKNGMDQPAVRQVQSPDSPLQADCEVPPHLTELYQRACKNLNPAEKEMVKALLYDFRDVFSTSDDDLGLTHLTEHVIETGDALPRKQAPHRVPIAFAGEDRKALDKLQKQGCIRPSTSPWASPIVLVRKKDGSMRHCVDYRHLNSVTQKDAFPLPRTEDCLDAVAGAKLFSTLDITAAYNQIPVREKDIPKTAFVTKHGLWEYTTMPFGLCNAPATFQRVMEVAMSGLQWNTCLIYLDDLIIFSFDPVSHAVRLRAVLERVRDSGLKLKPAKCSLFQSEVKFLGHVISDKGILPDPDNVQRLADWPRPLSVREVRAFLGLGNYYRRFVKGYSQLVRPLTELTKKDHTFNWTEDCEEAFQRLKEVLMGPEIMAYPLEEGEFFLDTDACDVSTGAVLSQMQGGRERVIAYASHTLNRAERNYCVTDRELLAVKTSIEHFKHYLLGRRFTVRSDHQALKWLFSLRQPKSRTARWIEALSAYDFQILYRPGTKHGNADGMSRCPNPRQCQCEDASSLKCGPCDKCVKRSVVMQSSFLEDEVVRRTEGGTPPKSDCTLVFLMWTYLLCFLVSLGIARGDTTLEASPEYIERGARTSSTWAMHYSPDVLHQKQLEDADIGPVLKWKEDGKRPSSEDVASASPATRFYWLNWDSLLIQHGPLCRKFQRKDGTATYIQLLIPNCLKNEILKQVHDSPLGGHLGWKKTLEKVRQRYFWFELREDVKQWVAKCDVCGAVKRPSRPPRAPLGSMLVGAPMDRLSTDILGPLPRTPRNMRYILVVNDHFTKWVEIFPVPDQTAVTCAQVIVNEVIARFGCPYSLHSDQGRNYESLLFSDLCKLLEIRKTRTSPANPRCNGMTERFNRTLITMIKSYLKGQQTDWDLNLGCLAAAYRASPHESSHLTPNMMMLGREVRLPIEVLINTGNSRSGEVASYGEYVTKLREDMQRAHEVARKYLATAVVRQKDTYDAKQNLHTYSPGTLVWYATDVKQLDITPKLRAAFEGPYLVVARLNDLNYKIQCDAKGTTSIVHHNKLKLYEGRKTLKWAQRALRRHRR